jgi:hypothetical protein
MYLYLQEYDLIDDAFEKIWMVSLDIGILFIRVLSFLLPLLLHFLFLYRLSPLCYHSRSLSLTMKGMSLVT